MNFMEIVYSFISVAALGAVLGIGLAIASRLLAVKKDERIEKVENLLPGLNCGACGFAGCASYAEAIVESDEELTKCSPGGAETATALAEVMGKEVDVSAEKRVAQVHCRGTKATSSYLYQYRGLKDCNALHLHFDGDKECKHGCLGLGSCIKVCPVDAIDYDAEGCVWVDRDTCIACGKCIDICPTGVIQWIPYDADYIVACNSNDKGGKVKKYCSVGCIGCKICEKKAPEGGFKVEDFLSRIDYGASGDRKAGADACPTKCIISVERTKTEKAVQEEEIKEKATTQ